MRMSAYAQSLRGPEALRYAEKVGRCEDVDPLALAEDELSSDADLWPKVDFADVRDYLVNGTSFATREQFKAVKSMEAHNFLTSGWVQQPRSKVLGDRNVVIVGKVRHSQSFREKPLQPWILFKPDGEVLLAHCTCMAGLGEACSHIGSILFYLEAVIKRREELTCTDKENAWLPPQLQTLEGQPVAKIDFASSRTKMRRLGQSTEPPQQAKEATVPTTSPDEFRSFLAACHQGGSRPALLSLVEPYAESYIPVATKFPQAILSSLLQDTCPSTWDEVQGHCDVAASRLIIEPEVSALIENQTKTQAASAKWFQFRAGRITASNARAVCVTSLTDLSMSLLRRICYPTECTFWSVQTQWGKDHEPDAKASYRSLSREQHMHLKCDPSGVHVSTEHPFLAATPDGLVSCFCCGPGLLEVKCPYKTRELFPAQIAATRDGCLTSIEGELQLKREHCYYYQVQMQMLVSKRMYCDFVVWTLKDTFIERICFSESFCNTMLSRCKEYFSTAVLPELCFKYWTNKEGEQAAAVDDPMNEDSDEQDSFCYCGGPEYGDMIQCDGESCIGKWFHFSCVKIKRAPKARKWFCKNCTSSSQH